MIRSLTLCFLLAALPAAGQTFPRPTAEGGKAFDQLLTRCGAAGGLKEEQTQEGGKRLTLADTGKLRAAVAANQTLLTATR